DGMWEAYLRYVRGFRPVLANMERRGIPVNATKLDELRRWIGAEVGVMNTEIQALVPEEVKPYEKKEAYKGPPAEVRVWLQQNDERALALAKSKRAGFVKTIELADPSMQAALSRFGYEVR